MPNEGQLLFRIERSVIFDRKHCRKGALRKIVMKGQPIVVDESENPWAIVSRIAWPAAVEALLLGAVDIVDMSMVSGLGLAAVSAVGVTSQPKRILLMFILSLNIGTTAFVSRRIGQKDFKAANHCMHQFIWITALLALLLYSAGIIFAEPFMYLAGANAETIQGAVTYFRIFALGQIPQAIGLTINAALRAEGKTKTTLQTNLTSNVVNVVFNYLLIQGHCGFPRLGIVGAALASSLGCVSSSLISVWSVRPGNSGILCLNLQGEKVEIDLPFLRSIWRVTFSAFREQFFQRLGLFVFTRTAASLGTVEFAVYQLTMNLANLQGYTYEGFASAATAITGQCLGMKKNDYAKRAGKCAVQMSYASAFLIAVVFLVFRSPIASIFGNDAYVISQAGKMIVFVAVSCIPCAGSTVYAGILRGAGDTKTVARVTLWIVAIFRPFVAWLLCYPVGIHQYGIWIAFTAAHILRWLFLGHYSNTGTWEKITL